MLKKLMPLMPELAIIIFCVVGFIGAIVQLASGDWFALLVLFVLAALGVGAYAWLKKRRAL